MLKILQARLQQFVNWELIQMYKVDLEKAKEFQKNIYFSSIDYAKASYCEDHNKLLRILKEMRITNHFTCLLRNLHVS